MKCRHSPGGRFYLGSNTIQPHFEPISGREYHHSGLPVVEVIGYDGKWTVDSIDVESGAWNVNGTSIGSSVDHAL
jgi:hypothetical protein